MMSPGLAQDGTKCGNNKVAKRINCNCLDCTYKSSCALFASMYSFALSKNAYLSRIWIRVLALLEAMELLALEMG